MIIILGDNKDTHSALVSCKLKKLQEDYCFLDTSLYPENLLIKWNPDKNNEGYLKIKNKKINFKDIKSVYWRNFNGIKFEKIENDDFMTDILYRERKSALYSLFYSLKTNWVNSMEAFEIHQKKAYALHLMKENNIRIPRTLITNDKNTIEEFFEQNNGEIIVKPILGGAYTEKLTKKNITKTRLQSLKLVPAQFQEYIDGDDIRVYAFKNDIFAVKINSNTVDFREDENAQLTKIELPQKVINDCYKVMKILKLKYSGIDIRLNKNGEYVFIEANPAPMFIHAEKVTKYPLTKSLIDMLINP